MLTHTLGQVHSHTRAQGKAGPEGGREGRPHVRAPGRARRSAAGSPVGTMCGRSGQPRPAGCCWQNLPGSFLVGSCLLVTKDERAVYLQEDPGSHLPRVGVREWGV